jgi:DMSO reductase anchor subunit
VPRGIDTIYLFIVMLHATIQNLNYFTNNQNFVYSKTTFVLGAVAESVTKHSEHFRQSSLITYHKQATSPQNISHDLTIISAIKLTHFCLSRHAVIHTKITYSKRHSFTKVSP